MAEPPIPWTFCPGNHDDDSSPWCRHDLLAIYSLPGCVTPEAQTFNHCFTCGFAPHADPHCSVRIWIFDSGGNDEATRYETISPQTVSAFAEISKSTLRSAPLLADLVFFHIPLPEYNDCEPIVGRCGLFDALVTAKQLPAPWKFCPWFVRAVGKDRVVGCSTLNSGLFDALVESRALQPGATTMAAFCGHDHYNDFVAYKRGLYLCYGRVSSFTPPSNWEGAGGRLPFESGGRVVEFSVGSGLVSTWIQTQVGEEPGTRLVLHGLHACSAEPAARVCGFRQMVLMGVVSAVVAFFMINASETSAFVSMVFSSAT